jgi:hypothetical protein
MITERDIFASANLMIQHHGDQARAVALSRADDFKKRGDEQGEAVWLRIADAVEKLATNATPDVTH